jgi:CRISPR-associated protein (TIGR03986 family)
MKAPFNFVPLSREVVLPNWANKISHDIPFEEGRSGELTLTIKAHSPIAVLSANNPDELDAPKKVIKHNGKPFIPGSSIKGMLRSVLEIMSFSKFGDKISDDRYAIRDLNGTVKDIYLANFRPTNVQCGWLQKLPDGSYEIQDCGIPGRVSHRNLDATLGSDFSTYFARTGRFDAKKGEQKSALFKYNRFTGKPRTGYFAHRINKPDGTPFTDGRKRFDTVDKEDLGAQPGTIVFTGQPGPRFQKPTGMWTGHHLEFVFFAVSRNLQISSQVMTNFLFAYYEHDKNRHSIDWKYWRATLANGDKVPVFFNTDDDGTIKHFGLSYLYKLPYENSIREAAENTSPLHTSSSSDLSECMFGYIAGSDALKGRVHVGAAVSDDAKEDGKVHDHVLSFPKASYYPLYLKQYRGPYKTLMDDTAELAGWKRYPVRLSNKVKPVTTIKGQEKISMKFTPLREGAMFKTSIRYHNLRPVELGALISAITFHGADPGTAFHSLGIAKPFGYGKVSITINNLNDDDRNVLLGAYEVFMDTSLSSQQSWRSSEQMRELLAMVSPTEGEGPDLTYMKLKNAEGKNEFKESKTAKETLKSHAEATGRVDLALKSYSEFARFAPEDIKLDEQRYAKFVTPATMVDGHFAALEQSMQQRLEQRKREVLNRLEKRREQLRLEEKDRKDQEKKDEAEKLQASGFDFSSFDLDVKVAFRDSLKVPLNEYLDALSRVVDLPSSGGAGGRLPAGEHEKLLKALKRVYSGETSSGKKNWKKSKKKNFHFKEVVKWVGQEKANEWWPIILE